MPFLGGRMWTGIRVLSEAEYWRVPKNHEHDEILLIDKFLLTAWDGQSTGMWIDGISTKLVANVGPRFEWIVHEHDGTTSPAFFWELCCCCSRPDEHQLLTSSADSEATGGFHISYWQVMFPGSESTFSCFRRLSQNKTSQEAGWWNVPSRLYSRFW